MARFWPDTRMTSFSKKFKDENLAQALNFAVLTQGGKFMSKVISSNRNIIREIFPDAVSFGASFFENSKWLRTEETIKQIVLKELGRYLPFSNAEFDCLPKGGQQWQ